MTPREWYDEARRLRALLARIEGEVGYNAHYTGEAVNGIDSRTAGRSRFPETAGRLRVHEGEAS